jgi:hypothetical protein
MRRLIALLMAFDAVLAATFLASLRPSPLSHPHAPGWLLGLGGNLPALIAIAVVAVGGSLQFARRAGAWAAGLVSLVCVGVLVEAQGALLQGPMRFLFFSGACLLGWLFGLGFARWEKLDDAVAVEALAEKGAAGALAAAYLGALYSKLAHTGIGWVVHGGLRSDIAGQHVWGRSRLLDGLTLLVLDHAWVAHLLSLFALVAQASALLLIGSKRARRVAGVLLLSFHAGVWLLMPIVFPQAMLLVAAFAFSRPSCDNLPQLGNRSLTRGAAVVALAVAVAWLPPLGAYTRFPHFRPRAASSTLTPPMRALLGDLVEGAPVADFRIDHIEEASPGDVRIRLLRGVQLLVIEVARHGLRSFPPPTSVGDYDLFFQGPQGEGEAVSDAGAPLAPGIGSGAPASVACYRSACSGGRSRISWVRSRLARPRPGGRRWPSPGSQASTATCG